MYVKKTLLKCALTALLAIPAFAAGPVFDNSGTASLTGTWIFRSIYYIVGSSTGAMTRQISLIGSVSFDGSGHYSIASGLLVLDTSVGYQQTSNAPLTGTYSLSASGFGSMSNPLSQTDTLYFTVSNGILIGSTTEGGYNDLMIAAQLSSPAPSNSTIAGSWSMVGFFPSYVGYAPTTNAAISYQFNADASGNISAMSVNGQIGSTGATTQTQNVPASKYYFSNGSAVLQYPSSSSALYFSGNEYMNFSPDGNFMFGGSPYDFDMIVGVRNQPSGTAPVFNGLYFQAGVDQDLSQYATSSFANFDTFYGSLNATSGVALSHQRLLSVFNCSATVSACALGSTFADSYPVPLTTTYNDTAADLQYTYGSNGKYRIGVGTYPYLGLNVAIQAPVLTAPASTSTPAPPWINPQGIVNAASSSPFTAGVSNGELITIYGSNLAAAFAAAPGIPFPKTLGGVQVTVNGLFAPIYYVSPSQIAVIVPYQNPYAVAQIQVSNNGLLSNFVTAYVYQTTPGIFTQNQNGLGYAAMQHANYSNITASNPANPGETIIVYLTGLGAVFPPVTEGTAAPASPLATTQQTITAGVAGSAGSVYFSGLTPTAAALYQVNFTVPTTATAGDNVLDIGGPDSYAAQALIPIAGATTTVSSVRTARLPDTRKLIDSPSGPALRRSPPELGISGLVKSASSN